jgi:hypothetical protein
VVPRVNLVLVLRHYDEEEEVFFVEIERVTAIALVGKRATNVLEGHGANPRRFVIGVAHGNEKVVKTPLGKVGVDYGVANNGTNHVVTLDIGDIRAIRGYEVQVPIDRRGQGSQQVGKDLEIVVVTSEDFGRLNDKQR